MDEVLDQSYVDLLVKTSLISSKSEARRMIQNGGVYLNGKKVADTNLKISKDFFIKENLLVLSVGKKKSLLLMVDF